MSVETKIMNELTNKNTWVFCIKDMLLFGDYKAVAKAIERLTTKGLIRRIIQGIYYYPEINQLFNLEYPPEIEDVASAISRNNNWEIRETGNTALYKLGMDNQIPTKYVYLSSGPYRTYRIGNRIIEFKNSSQRNFIFSMRSSLVVQSLKALGVCNIGDEELRKLSSYLTHDDKKHLLNEMKYAPVWMHPHIKKIGEINDE